MEHQCNLNDVMLEIGTLKGVVKEGFEGIHRRQDITNGRIDKSEAAIAVLQTSKDNEDGRRSAFNWVSHVISGVIGIGAGIVGSLITAGKL